jgi:hypothetical protein
MQNNMRSRGPATANQPLQTDGIPRNIASEYASTSLNVGTLLEILTPS